MNEVTITLTVDETNTLLALLGELPHNKVHQLMWKIYHQGSEQASKFEPASEEEWDETGVA